MDSGRLLDSLTEIGTVTAMESRPMFNDHVESPSPRIPRPRTQGRRDNKMSTRTDTLTRPRKAPVPLCVPCRGTGQDPQAPSRAIPGRQGDILYLVRPCSACEGHGVQPRKQDRDLARFDYLTP